MSQPKPDLTWKPTGFYPGVYPRDDYWSAIQGMCSRMCVSEQKYGSLETNYPTPADALATLRERLAKYEETGNTEWLLDVANMAVIEYLFPSHATAHFRATDSDESPGLRQHGEGTVGA